MHVNWMGCKTAAEADEYCRTRNGRLASVLNDDEREFIANTLAVNDQDVWIGTHKDGNEWKWRWGQAFDFTAWANNEPSAGNCVVQLGEANDPEGHHWEAIDCEERRQFICEGNAMNEWPPCPEGWVQDDYGCTAEPGTVEETCDASGSGGGSGEEEEPDAIPVCLDEFDMPTCHNLAYCIAGEPDYCECMPGTRDVSESGASAGTLCQDTGFAVRFVLNDEIKASNVGGRRSNIPVGITNTDMMGPYCHASNAQGWYLRHVDTDLLSRGQTFTEVYCIYTDADTASADLNYYASKTYPQGSVTAGPGVYRWVLPTTSNPVQVPPTGMTVDSVQFDISCALSGCWVIKGVVTTGERMWENNAFNTFFLPHADVDHIGDGDGDLSYDFDYGAGGNKDASNGDIGVEWTFEPAKHPCSSVNFDATSSNTQNVVSCCITNDKVGETGEGSGNKGGFLANYRPTVAFSNWATDASSGLATCYGTSGAQIIGRPDDHGSYNVSFPTNAVEFLSAETPTYNGGGKFTGMSTSPGVTKFDLTDPFFGQYEYEIELDEVELRSKAGQLRGTVGVEHTIDTFLGLANFKTTGLVALDTFAIQVAIHLEKTSFFTVSTQGTNDYTFLEYVNLRLVAVYNEDSDFSGTDESGSQTVRTNSANAANYIQVTFTLGSKYGVNANSGLIPLDSVRAGEGSFFDSAPLAHKCLEWTNDGASFDRQDAFNTSLQQTCAPAAAMCASPTAIPDSFVSFNIPLGVGFFNQPSDTLSENVFVDMVISAVDNEARGDDQDPTDPNDGEAPWQMKTTLTASIPVVEGGINIFCDGYTAKSDLKDVADADIVVGSASSPEELTRLRIKKNIASTQLSPSSITPIDSESIEAGLMTLVLKGNASYFQTNTGRREVTVELEDVITIHIMESDGDIENTNVGSSVMDLITAAPEDNSDTNGLITDGYALNGAFFFTIDRAAQRAHLEPSGELLGLCPFNPPRPSSGNAPLETCVTRRDVRYREYPWRSGAKSTAMEICVEGSPGTQLSSSGSCTSATTSSDEASFMVSLMGDNTFARQLAVDYANVISAHYDLNGRYRRAYWINPGYEWTPTQTGGTPLFSVSQKLFMFALITLDEGLTDAPGNSFDDGPGPSFTRRRMLLQSTTDEQLQDGQARAGADAFEFATTARSMMARAYKVPEDRVATFKVTLQLTSAEACMTPTELQASIRATLHDYLSTAASSLHTVQVTQMSVERGRVSCRRALRSLLSVATDASAEVTMLVVFREGTVATLSVEELSSMPGVQTVEPLVVSAKVDTSVSSDFQHDTSAPGSSSSSSSASVGLIVGIAGGAVVLVGVMVGGFVVWSRRRAEEPACMAVQTINVNDLKHQLSEDA